MQAPKTLLSRIGEITGAAKGLNRLVIVMGQLGDFDSMEYAQALAPRLQQESWPCAGASGRIVLSSCLPHSTSA